ncbi:MAG: hypothetical protein E6K54_02295 [Gammaproteobacteria bacterium]|nr:MAG: hypothetical protein E6K54_02295 [Gammaproteobacteria bacterium]
MPIQEKSILFALSQFESVAQTNNPQKLENYLMELMSLANKYYDEIYLKYRNNPDIEKFNSCRQIFNQIMSIIKLKELSTPLINKLYIEAWISALYSDVHALNLQPETEKQLNELNEKIQAISNKKIRFRFKG